MGYLFKRHKFYKIQGSTMTQKHSITPLSELVQDWAQKAQLLTGDDPVAFAEILCNKAARWGADQELEACYADVQIGLGPNEAEWLRSVRRPKPLSLKKVAYDALDTYIYGNPDPKDKERTYNAIRRALESLPD